MVVVVVVVAVVAVAVAVAARHLHQRQLLEPSLRARGERLDERAALHRLRLDDVVVEQQLDVVDAADDVGAGVAVLLARELQRLPLGEHAIQRLLQRPLLRGDAGDILELLEVAVEVHPDHLQMWGMWGVRSGVT